MLVSNNYVCSTCFSSVKVAEEKLITSLHQLRQELPQYDDNTIRNLIDISRGPVNGRMETLGLVKCVKNDKVYDVDGKTLKLSNKLFALDLEAEACNPPMITVPSHLEFTAEWDKRSIASGNGNNILGDNGGLFFDVSTIRIPKVKATKETLAYYGAVLIPENSAIRFPNDQAYPLWKMHVGPNYVRDYVMTTDGGGGFYLEYHYDQPHFHMVVNGGGYYLLAKQIRKDTYHITAFELANGQAVYTKKGALHCDAALTGDLVCGYSTSEDCSTVLLRTKNKNEMVKVEFV